MTSRSSSWPWRATFPDAAGSLVTLIQIGLPRARAQPNASLSRDAVEAHASVDAVTRPSLAPTCATLALAGGLILLAPLVLLAHSLLLVGLLVLALIAALLHTHPADLS